MTPVPQSLPSSSAWSSPSRAVQLPTPSVRSHQTDGIAKDASTPLAWTPELSREIELLATRNEDIVKKAGMAVGLLLRCGASSAGYLAANQSGELRLCSAGSNNGRSSIALPSQLVELCRKASVDKERRVFSTVEDPNSLTLCVAIGPNADFSDVLVVTRPSRPIDGDRELLRNIEQVVLALQNRHALVSVTTQDEELQRLSALIELVGKIHETDSMKTAAPVIVNELQRFIGCRQIGLGLIGRLRIGTKLEALSGLTTFDKLSDLAEAFQAAGDEASRHEELCLWPPLNPQSGIGLLALRKLMESQNTEAAIGVPLIHHARVKGVLVLTGTNHLRDPRVLGLLQTASTMLGSALHHVGEMEKSVWKRAWLSAGRSRWAMKSAVAAVVSILAVTLACPWPYTMRVPCKAEPTTRRIVGAPYDGLIDSALLRSGNLVKEKQLLATMDARELRWEMSTLTAEKTRFRKEYDKELAADNIAKAQLAQLEVERITRKLELLRHREREHAILSPISGMILTGEPEKLTGAPVRMGQALFEVAQLDPLRIDLEIPAADYFYLKAGQAVSIRFDGFAFEAFQGRVKTIRPRAEIRDNRNVFVAELEIANQDFRIRPGVQGRAVVTGDRFPLGWNLFHKAWEVLRRSGPTDLLSFDDSMAEDQAVLRLATAAR